MAAARWSHTATLLASGKVLVTGDHGGGGRVVKLPGGRWLFAGGALPTSPQTNTGAAEILTE